jgi:hypothetical protein
MTDLALYGRRVETVFELLGEAEDDITYSVGWGLAQGGGFARALLHRYLRRLTASGRRQRTPTDGRFQVRGATVTVAHTVPWLRDEEAAGSNPATQTQVKS